MQLSIRTNLNFYRLVPLALMLWPAGNAVADYVLASLRISTTNTGEPVYLAEGDKVAGYKVSSEYDLDRVHPVKGIVEPHYGIDLATPIGTKLIAPTTIQVGCWYDINGGGEVAVVDQQVQLLHLSTCIAGTHSAGETFALTGDSGLGTGAHLDARRLDKTEPSKEEIEPYLTGKLPAAPFPVIGKRTDSTLSDRELICGIGAAEGTRDRRCRPTTAYSGHIDPGNGADNLGTFSYQHGAGSPEDADKRQLVRLRRAETDLQSQSKAKFGKPLSKPALGAALDLWNQSPQAGEAFVEHLPSPTPTNVEIVQARSRSYLNPITGELDAPGLGNDAITVEVDQARRTDAVLDQVEQDRKSFLQWRLEQLDK